MTTSTPAVAVSGSVESITVKLGQTPVAPGETTSVKATVSDTNGTGLAAQVVTLTSSDSSVTLADGSGATDSSGVFATTASVSSGTADKTVTITATAGGKRGTAVMSVQTRGVTTGSTTYAGVPAGTVLSANGTKLYIAGRSRVNNVMRRTVNIVDPSTFAVISTISLQSQFDKDPLVVKRSPDGSRLVAMSGTAWAVIDTSTDTVLTYLQYGNAVGFVDVDIDRDNRYLYLTMTDGVLRFDAMSPSTSPTRYGIAHGSPNGTGNILLSRDSGRVYWIDRRSSQGSLLRVTDIPSNTSVSSQTIADSSSDLTAMALSPDGSTLYAATQLSGVPVVRAINTSSFAVISTVALPAGMCDIVTTPDGARLILLDGSGNTYSLLLSTGSVSSLATPPVSGTASYQALSIAPSGKTVFATIAPSSGSGRVFGVTT